VFGVGLNPFPGGGQAAAGDDEMQVEMLLQPVTPALENGYRAGPGSEPFFIGRKGCLTH
jgi:hypothetical protein